MKFITLLSALAISVTSMNALAVSGENATMVPKPAVSMGQAKFSFSQKEAIEQIVHEYLVQHPEVLIEAAHVLQAKQAEQQQAQAMTAITANKTNLFANPDVPVGGNPDGNVVLVEFFDYQCGHCKAMQPIITQLISKNPNIKLVYDELPIFGDNSEYAAKAALAARKQNKFKEFHQALFAAGDGLDPEKIMKIAASVGLNTTQLANDMKDPAIAKQIKDNFNLAQELRLVGTPSFILANKNLTHFDYVPGATSEADIQQRIDQLAKVQTQKSS